MKHPLNDGNDLTETIEEERVVAKKQRQLQDEELDNIFETSDLDLFLKDVSVPLVSSIEGTPEIDAIIGASEEAKEQKERKGEREDQKGDGQEPSGEKEDEKQIVDDKEGDKTPVENKGTGEESAGREAETKEVKKEQEVNKEQEVKKEKEDKKEKEKLAVKKKADEGKGAIIGNSASGSGKSKTKIIGVNREEEDMERARRYLHEKYELINDVSLSNRLLKKKLEEDEGLESEDSEGYSSEEYEEQGGEEFEDLLELFDINPDEMSLDLTINEKRKLLIDSMDDKQLNRYEFFRRTNLNSSGIKKLVNSITGISVSNEFAKLLSGVGKVFVGEIVERAKLIQRNESEARVRQQLLMHEKYGKQGKQGEQGESEEIAVPSFYPLLLQQETGASSIHIKRLIESTEINKLPIVIPSEELQLTPDHVRSSWYSLNSELSKNGVVKEPWRSSNRSNGSFF